MAADGVVPDVRDGLTPACRRALQALTAVFRPAARVVDDVLRASGRDGRRRAIYGELVRMARDWELRHPLVEARGNLGSINGDEAASADYTELRITEAGAEALAGRLPNLLVNGSFAVASGAAPSVPPHNLREVAGAALALVEDPEIGVEGLLRQVRGPDFPTGAVIARAGLPELYETGRGTITMRARAAVERGAIVVGELPFGLVTGGRDGVLAEIVRAVRSRRIVGVGDIEDCSDERHGLRIVLELEPGASAAATLEQLFAHTRLQTTVELRLVAAVEGAERTLTLRDAIAHWVAQLGSPQELHRIAERHGDERRTEIV